MHADIGVIGLGVMGANLSRNFASKGYTVAVHDMSTEKTAAFGKKFASEGNFIPGAYLKDFVDSLVQPRRIIMMVPAGGPTDAAINEILPLLSPGDVLVDGGNSHFADTRRREADIRPTGVPPGVSRMKATGPARSAPCAGDISGTKRVAPRT